MTTATSLSKNRRHAGCGCRFQVLHVSQVIDGILHRLALPPSEILLLSATGVLTMSLLLLLLVVSHYIHAAPKLVDEYWRLYGCGAGRWLEVDLKCLHWTPLAADGQTAHRPDEAPPAGTCWVSSCG